jgi:hypothetical protein
MLRPGGLNIRSALGKVAKDPRTLLYLEKMQQQALENTPAAAAAALAAAEAAQTTANTADANALAAGEEASTAAAAAAEAQATAAEALEAATNGTSVPVVVSEVLAPRSMVSLWNDAGSGKMRLADNTDDTKQVDGFVQLGYGIGNTGRLQSGGQITGFTALTPGAKYFLGTAGGITLTPPTTVGNWLQEVGRAIDDQRLLFEPKPGVRL